MASLIILLLIASIFNESECLVVFPRRDTGREKLRSQPRETNMSKFDSICVRAQGLPPRLRAASVADTIDDGDGNSRDNDDESQQINQFRELLQERTLYQILQVDATATRQEIKRNYFRLAKLSHPDALLNQERNTQDNNKSEDTNIDFQEIAEAWKILGNSKLRRRYDRELKAKEWSLKAQAYTNERLEQAVPVVADMMDKVAVPFLRRTTATTWAVGKAIATGFSRSNERKPSDQRERPASSDANGKQQATESADPSISTSKGAGAEVQNMPISDPVKTIPIGVTDTFMQALEAGQHAAREIDSLELKEKSDELLERAKEEAKRGKSVAQELNDVQEQRLFGTLQSTNMALSANDAKEVLQRLDINETISIVDRAMLRNSLEEEIECLNEKEMQFTEKLDVYEEADREWNELLGKEEIVKQSLSVRKNKEIEARKAFDAARQDVAVAKEELVQTSNELRGVEQQVKKTAQEMDRITSVLSRKQKRVRDALRRKTELMKGGIQVQYVTEEELTALRRREIQLIGESKEIAETVSRLESRAEKLRNRAEKLREWQKEWSNAEKREIS